MRLRNKETGKIIEFEDDAVVAYSDNEYEYIEPSSELCGEEDEPKGCIEVITKEYDHADAIRKATENLCGEEEE